MEVKLHSHSFSVIHQLGEQGAGEELTVLTLLDLGVRDTTGDGQDVELSEGLVGHECQI